MDRSAQRNRKLCSIVIVLELFAYGEDHSASFCQGSPSTANTHPLRTPERRHLTLLRVRLGACKSGSRGRELEWLAGHGVKTRCFCLSSSHTIVCQAGCCEACHGRWLLAHDARRDSQVLAQHLRWRSFQPPAQLVWLRRRRLYRRPVHSATARPCHPKAALRRERGRECGPCEAEADRALNMQSIRICFLERQTRSAHGKEGLLCRCLRYRTPTARAYAGSGRNSVRHRVRDNLPAIPDFCRKCVVISITDRQKSQLS